MTPKNGYGFCGVSRTLPPKPNLSKICNNNKNENRGMKKRRKKNPEKCLSWVSVSDFKGLGLRRGGLGLQWSGLGFGGRDCCATHA